MLYTHNKVQQSVLDTPSSSRANAPRQASSWRIDDVEFSWWLADESSHYSSPRRNAACLLQAGRVRGAVDLGGDSGWEEDIDDLLRDAAAAAAAGGVEW